MIFTGERVIEGVTPQRIWIEHVKRYEFASAFIKNMKGGLTLDIACGTGYGCKILSNKGNIPEIIGVDISREAISFACANYKTAEIEFVIGDAVNLPFSKEKFDYVVCFETLEHIKTPEKMLQELRRILKSNGLLIISTPNRKLTSPGKSIRDQPDNPYHIVEYSTNEFIRLLSKYFEVLEVYGQRGISKFYLIPVFEKILRIMFPTLYAPERYSCELEKIRSTKEYRYIVAICKKQ